MYTCGLNQEARLGQEQEEGQGCIREFKIVQYFSDNMIKVKDIATGGRHCIVQTIGESTQVTPITKETKENIYVWGINHLH